MKIVLASASAVKIAACRKAFPGAEIVAVRVPSGVAEQPFGEETLTGAFNRLAAARRAAPDADLYISIESGLFNEADTWVDRAVIVLEDRDGARQISASDGVPFPDDCIEEARRRGFEVCTPGKIMQERGIVANPADPHLSLTGKSRAAYINEALTKAAAKFSIHL